ncbi:FAD-dependent oxidoreductase [soil metagenome]
MSQGRVDVAVVGAGFAGLSAALTLRRHRRSVIVFDGGPSRNAWSAEVHGYLGASGLSGPELRQVASTQVAQVGGQLVPGRVKSVRPTAVKDPAAARDPTAADDPTAAEDEARADGDDPIDGALDGGFSVGLTDDRVWRADRVLLATGVRDEHPDIEGFSEFFGRSVHVCPHCDGYEWRDQPVAVIAWSEQTRPFSLTVAHWGSPLTVLTHGHRDQPDDSARASLERQGISVVTTAIRRLEGRDGQLEAVRFRDGSELPVRAAFFNIDQRLETGLAESLGCALGDEGQIQVDEDMRTSVTGVWAAGDVVGGEQFVAIATAHGVKAALDIHASLPRRTEPGQ